ncbi:hypothetical protein CLAFUW4_10388 [Fulvia fulva]|uniref:PHD-type domain-containing protein n=1 Tax=Passalora fulva TaxID=5499 RepID=A0A9Q8P771_PASFU|nr:uncharacterized protein CLAFUR5_05003 [Fulvia fulva]KAK4616190.1 hypothetical protein CLAFUR4_10392 [Fulvia fulva]KAK4617159.1 hypothetical protein CLAFUR0_10393 [Fulvia fulva]UJO15706.1 hypothetical protein CLAFUR5_05003 [Fulvia fulva]WPV19165.1 hypothetical protein CLAFUW4_10388 [Fulvia fulva]WPV34029.1 hypothetical protein CLAFUW7_10388 [Fulvia fulva]
MSATVKKTSSSAKKNTSSLEPSHDPSQADSALDSFEGDGADEENAETDNEDMTAYCPDMPYCSCRESFDEDDEDHGDMVECDNPACLIAWFHLKCTGLKVLPTTEEKWECNECEHPKFRIPTPNWERLVWYGEKVYVEGYTMD